MSTELTFTSFPVALMERAYRRMLQAVDGLTDEQLWFQPGPGTNPIGWLVWHLSRFKDIQTARVVDEIPVWAAEGWAGRFGLSEEASGFGATPDEVAAFRAELSLLLGYAEAAHVAAVRRVSGATEDQLRRAVGSDPARSRAAYELLLINAIDYTEHTGQIMYLRGIVSGPGWSGRA